MTIATMEGANPARLAPWASHISVVAVYLFVVALFLQNVRDATLAAILGILLIHGYNVIVLLYWRNVERSATGDAVIVTLTLMSMLLTVLFWDRFRMWPWTTFFSLVVVQFCAFAVVRSWNGLRKAPPTAWFGLVVILFYVMVAATAPIVAPFTGTEIVGAEYETWGAQFLLGTDNPGRDG